MVLTSTRTDSRIQQDVLRELKWDTHVGETAVGVEVDHGVVTLSGTVDSYAARLAAQAAAHRVPGVLDVANDIRVHLPGSRTKTDTQIAQAVRRALEWDVYVLDERITSTVADGWVALEGDVDYWSQRADAERAVLRLAGVRGVTNRITVRRNEVPAETIREAIESTLERRAEREAERIQVAVSDGIVTLRGRVHSWAEKRAILGAVSHAPGVNDVTDDLVIDPYA
jgi:osmotically-inducible protein OsmY